jgi:hypothetical protein
MEDIGNNIYEAMDIHYFVGALQIIVFFCWKTIYPQGRILLIGHNFFISSVRFPPLHGHEY